MTRKALALGALIALLACGTAQADDTYRVTAGGDQNWGPQGGGLEKTSPTPLDERDTMTDNRDAIGTVDWHMQSGPGITRASMDGNVTVPSNLAYPFNPSLQAVSTTDVTVNGPAFEINTSLNLHVDGFIETPDCHGNAPCGALNAHMRAPTSTTALAVSEFDTLGTTRANDMGLHFDPEPGGYHIYGDVTSREFGIRTGTPIPLGIVLALSGRFGGHSEGATFGGSFDDPVQHLQVSFATSGPVLNVPAGYTVSGSSVVNNRWYDPFPAELVVDDCNDPALSQAVAIRGNLVLHQLASCPQASFPHLTHIGGDIVIDGDHAPHVSFPGPVLVDGSVRVVGNSGGGDLDISDGSVGGAIDVSGNGGDLTVDVGSVGGAIDVSGTGGDLTVDTGSVGEAIDVSGTGGDLTIDPGTTGGDLDISDNPGADVIDVGDGQIGGDLTITDDGTAVVNANDSLTVSGDATVETDGGGMLDLSGVEADGDETVAGDGTDAVAATTAGGTTDVSIGGGTAAMHVVLPDGAFDQPVAFTITRRGDDPAQGAVDPLAGYAFAFAVPALNADARLSFTVDLDALDPATRAALLAGIADGSATIATRPDAPGSSYTAFARCTGTQTPAADACVSVTQPSPSLVRFDGIAGHFSTYAVALVSSGPTAAQIRALLRRQMIPDGKAGRIRVMLKRHGYRLRFRALTAGTGKVRWFRTRKGHKPILIARGSHTFAAAGRTTFKLKLTAAGRRQLRHAKRRLRLQAKGAFTPAGAAAVTAKRRFTVRR